MKLKWWKLSVKSLSYSELSSDSYFIFSFIILLGCSGYWLSSQHVVVSPKSESKRSYCWMVISLQMCLNYCQFTLVSHFTYCHPMSCYLIFPLPKVENDNCLLLDYVISIVFCFLDLLYCSSGTLIIMTLHVSFLQLLPRLRQ